MLPPQITPQPPRGPEQLSAGVEHTQAARVWVRVWQVVAAVAAGMTVLLALWPSAGHDQLWLLLVAGRMGSGLDPYRAVFEANPPLPAWLSWALLQLAQVLHLPAVFALKGAVVTLAAAVAISCGRLLKLQDQATRWFLLAVFVLLAGAAPARDFGQRDHALALLVLPYLVVASLPSASHGARAMAALAAALGIALKPHQALLVLAVELLLAVRRRRPRLLEPALFLLAGAVYAALVIRLTPEFLQDVVPVLRDTYWANGSLGLGALVWQSVQLHLLAGLALAAFLTQPRRSPLPAVLLAGGLGATAAFYLQDTGWYYHQLPALVLFSFALALLLAERVQLAPVRWLRWATATLGALALGLTWHFMGFQPNPLRAAPAGFWAGLRALDPPQETPAPALYAGLPKGAPVLTLTPTVDDAVMPMVLYHLTLAQRYPQFWMLPALLRAGQDDLPRAHRLTSARWAELAGLQRRMMVEDLDRWHPVLILVERCQDPEVLCQAIGERHRNLLAFFQADPAFRSRFAQYRLVQRAGSYDAYRRQ